jgi:hypothetical protein
MSDVHRWTTAGGIAVVAATDHDAKIESLRSRLAAADALLDESGHALGNCTHPGAADLPASQCDTCQLMYRIDAHLAAARDGYACPNCAGAGCTDCTPDNATAAREG